MRFSTKHCRLYLAAFLLTFASITLLINGYSVMTPIVQYDRHTFVFNFTIFYLVNDYCEYLSLVIIPVKCLRGVLENKLIVLSEIKGNNEFTVS